MSLIYRHNASHVFSGPGFYINRQYRAADNAAENNVQDRVQARLGDITALAGESPFDLILANINRNVLLGGYGSLPSVSEAGPPYSVFRLLRRRPAANSRSG